MHGRVLTTEQLTPSLVRVVLGGDGLDDYAPAGESTDTYVNLAIPPRGAPYGEVFDPRAVREEHPKSLWPARRRYTVRAWDESARELTVDFVAHGDEGVAGSWAAHAEPGDTLVFEGPAGGYRPDAGADWHLMVGDESALPAIAASLEAVGADVPVHVVLLCDGPDHEIPLETPGRLHLLWCHRDGSATELYDAVRALDFPAGRVHAFVHGEAEEIRDIRRHLLAERGLTRAQMSCSPYWRRTMTDEAWREVKGAFVTAMDSDVPDVA